MRIPRPPHPWNLSVSRAMEWQRRLAAQVIEKPLSVPARWVAGLDAAFSPDGKACLAAVVVWDLEQQRDVAWETAEAPVRFPYIPGLLSFREAPALLAALRRLDQPPDVLMCDGQGLAHPRRFGLACHLGVICNLPALGCAKSRLLGTHGTLAAERGSCAPLYDRDEVVGCVVRTRAGVNPVFVSVGHRLVLAEAVELALRCATRFRLPEPTRLADRWVAQAKQRFLASSDRSPSLESPGTAVTAEAPPALRPNR